MRQSRSEFIKFQDMTLHVRRWGTPGARRLFLLHGWLDCSVTFQFLVDALENDWDIVAPDWRGCGQSDWQNSPYWILQYVADIERLLALYSEHEPALIVGHSLGGNVASIFSAVRPARVSRLVILDAYGTGEYEPENLATRIDRWLMEQTRDLKHRKSYPDIPSFARKLIQNNYRLSEDQALFLATEFSVQKSDGAFYPAIDPYQRLKPPPLFDGEDYKRLWKSIEAPVLLLIASESFLLRQFRDIPDELENRIACFRDITVKTIVNASHNLHHDQPRLIANHIEDFLSI